MLGWLFVRMTAPAVMQHNTLNLDVSEFHPSTRQHDDPVNNSFSATGRGPSMPSAGSPTLYISQNMGGTVYFIGAIDSDHEDPQQELIQPSFPSTANQVLMQHPFPSSAGVNYNRRDVHLTQPMAATVRDAHRSGNPFPDGSGWFHWHYAISCHEGPGHTHGNARYSNTRFLSAMRIVEDCPLATRQILSVERENR